MKLKDNKFVFSNLNQIKMALFNENDLAFIGYSKTVDINNNHENSRLNYINKTNQTNVIDFCNRFLENYDVAHTKANFQKVEILLQHPFIENQISEDHLSDWIASNWIKKIPISN